MSHEFQSSWYCYLLSTAEASHVFTTASRPEEGSFAEGNLAAMHE